jgi:hypothetical protein
MIQPVSNELGSDDPAAKAGPARISLSAPSRLIGKTRKRAEHVDVCI